MGSNFRQQDPCCILEDEEEEEEQVPQTFRGKLRYYLRRFKQRLPEFISYIIIGIMAVCVAFLIQAHHQRETMKDVYSNITDLKDSINSRLEDVEKALTRLALSCGSSISLEGEEGGDKEDSTENLIMKHLRKYDADKTGMIDWALESLGGSIVTVRGTESYVLGGTSVLGIPCSKFSSDSAAIIRPSRMPGDCWAFKGEGAAVIRLVTPVYVTNVTLEHIPKEMTPEGEISSAPKIFVVWGLPSDSPGGLKHSFGHFEYKSTGEPVQTFPIQFPSYSSYDLVEFNFKSNHGNKDFTCVYRIRVHGQLTMDG